MQISARSEILTVLLNLSSTDENIIYYNIITCLIIKFHVNQCYSLHVSFVSKVSSPIMNTNIFFQRKKREREKKINYMYIKVILQI